MEETVHIFDKDTDFTTLTFMAEKEEISIPIQLPDIVFREVLACIEILAYLKYYHLHATCQSLLFRSGWRAVVTINRLLAPFGEAGILVVYKFWPSNTCGLEHFPIFCIYLKK